MHFDWDEPTSNERTSRAEKRSAEKKKKIIRGIVGKGVGLIFIAVFLYGIDALSHANGSGNEPPRNPPTLTPDIPRTTDVPSTTLVPTRPPETVKPTETPEFSGTFKNTSNKAINIRAFAGTDKAVVGKIEPGVTVNLIYPYTTEPVQNYTWAQIDQNGTRGWVATELGTVISSEEVPEPTAVPTDKQPAFSSTPEQSTPNETRNVAVAEISTDRYPDFKIQVDGDGIPISYRSKDGLIVLFSPEDRQNFAAAKAQAITDQSPFLAWEMPIEIDTQTAPFVFTKEHPAITELPETIATTEQLKSYGVEEIIQGKNTRLSIDISAFEGGELDKLRIMAQYPDTPKLTIVILDGPRILYAYSNDSKYDSVRGLLDGDNGDRTINIEEMQANRISYYSELITSLELELSQAIQKRNQDPNSPDLSEVLGEIQTLNSGIRYYKNILTYYTNASIEELALEESEESGINTIGQYVYDSYLNRGVIFLASPPDPINKDRIQIWYSATGQMNVDTNYYPSYDFSRYVPDPSRSFPQVDDYTITEDPVDDSYVVEDFDLAHVLRHEKEHYLKMTVIPTLSLIPYDNSTHVTFIPPNFSERDTDLGALAATAKNEEQWKDDEHDLDSDAYPFYFEHTFEGPNGPETEIMRVNNQPALPESPTI